MTVGSQGNEAQVNQNLTSLALQWRNLAAVTLQQGLYLNEQGLTGLEAMGFTTADAQTVLNLIDYMTTCAQVYKGLAAQATDFNFENALIPLWAGQ